MVRRARFPFALALTLAAALPLAAQAQTAPPAAPPPLPSLITATPAEGFDLAVRLARRAIPLTQREAAVRGEIRAQYSRTAEGLIAASHVVAVHFQTIAAANDYWRPRQ